MENNPFSHAEQLFVALSATKALNQHSDEKLVLLGDVIPYVMGNAEVDNQAVSRAISNSIVLRKHYNNLLQQNYFAQGRIQAAASSAMQMTERSGEGFKLLFKMDKIRVDLTYIILKIDHPDLGHRENGVTLHTVHQEKVQRLLFPPLIDGKTQLLRLITDDDYQLLIQPDAELFLIKGSEQP